MLTRRPGTTTTFFAVPTLGELRELGRSPARPLDCALSALAATRMRAAQLAVDLQHQLDLVLHQRVLVDLRPRRVEQRAVVAAKPSSFQSVQVRVRTNRVQDAQQDAEALAQRRRRDGAPGRLATRGR